MPILLSTHLMPKIACAHNTYDNQWLILSLQLRASWPNTENHSEEMRPASKQKCKAEQQVRSIVDTDANDSDQEIRNIDD